MNKRNDQIRLAWAGLAAISILVILTRGAATADETQIVRDGQPFASIVLAPEPHVLEQEAAADLQWAVERATGITLDLRNPGSVAGNKIMIRIGSAAINATGDGQPNLQQQLAALPYDGAVVHVTPERIDIVGPTPAGTANGVATVLLEDIGVRMYYPDPLFAMVPERRTLAIRARRTRPSFDYRVWSGLVGSDAAAYRRRNRLTDAREPVRYFGFGHSLGRFIAVEKYGRSHPEYFAYRDGARRPRGTGVGSATQPCFTNPDVVRLTIEAAREFFNEHPERDTFPLCVNDNARYCECDKCASLDEPYRDLPVGRQYSESYFDYVARVAAAVAKSHPDRWLGVYAYWNVEQPPRNRTRLPDNVIVALTLDILQHYDPAYRDKDRALIRAWRAYAKRLHTYVYYGLGWFTPRTSPRLVAEDLSFAAAHGVRAIYCESYPFWAWCGPMHYVAARRQWDVDADVGQILQEFHRDCFGDVAAEMRAYHDICERYWCQPRHGRWFEGLGKLAAEEEMANLALLRAARTHLETAFAKTQDPDVRNRIAWLRPGIAFAAAVGEAFAVKQSVVRGSGELASLIDAAELVAQAYGPLAENPAYRHTYYQPGNRFDRRCWNWFRQPVLAAARTKWRQFQQQSPTEAEARWKTFRRQSGLEQLLAKRGWELKLDAP